MIATPYEPKRFRSTEYLAVIDEEPASTHVNITSSALNSMRQQGETGYPLEICGLLIGRSTTDGWTITDARQVDNLNSERAVDRFQLDPAGYQAIDKELRGSDLEIVGVYHSHPDCPAKPSPTDLGSAWDGFAYPIISICDGKATDMRCWSLNEQGKRFQQVTIGETT